ncbi:MAG: hypothetical protein DRN78_04025 [Thermoproteota archaeon]|nr:MAG: hypothetical protein DRN78_04025 [Candidatus Korarchaeota archaeon]
MFKCLHQSIRRMNDITVRIKESLSKKPNIVYAILFGSAAEDRLREDSDIDVAIRFFPEPDVMELGEISSLIESVVGRAVHVVNIVRAPPPLRYEIFKNGVLILVRDEGLLAEDKARAIMEYLDFRPHYENMAKGLMRALGNA